MHQLIQWKSNSPGFSVLNHNWYRNLSITLQPNYPMVHASVSSSFILSYEQRTKPITSAKGRGWNDHRFLCVPYRSWGFGVRGHEMTKWLKKNEKIEAEAAEEKAAMKMNSFLLARKPFWRSLWGCVCKDSETKKMVIVRSSFWSSFWAAFHFRIFEVCSFCAWY